MKNQLTVRGFGDDLAGAVRRLAAREQISLNQVAVRLLRQGAGLSDPAAPTRIPGRPIESLFGTWAPGNADAVCSWPFQNARWWTFRTARHGHQNCTHACWPNLQPLCARCHNRETGLGR